MRIRVWFNVGEKDPAKKWVVQVGDEPLQVAEAVVTMCMRPSVFRTGPDTPTGWFETTGVAERMANVILIR